jgi:SAM-dependent methyltransferase
VSPMSRELSDRERFDAIASGYARKDIEPASALARRYQLMFAVEPVLARRGTIGTLIEIGCGAGAVARYLAGRYTTYVGLDYSARLIEAARTLNAGNRQAEFVVGDIKDTRLGVRGDLLLMVGALHHMTDNDAVIRALRELALPGADLVVVEPSRGNPVISLLRAIRSLVDPGYSRDQEYYTRGDMTSLFTRHGLVDVTARSQGYVSKPFGQVILPGGRLALLASRAAVALDRRLDRCMPDWLGLLAWDVVVRARFPE